MRHQLNCCISSSMQHFSQFVPRYTPGQNKKNAGIQAGVGILLQKNTLFFRRIRCLTRKLRADGRRKKSWMSSRTVHSVRLLPFIVQAAVPNPAQNTCHRLRFEEGSQNSWADPHRTAFCSFVLCTYSQLSAPPVWYSITRVSKKLRSFFRSIISLIQGKGFSSCGNKASSPICCARRLAMKRR